MREGKYLHDELSNLSLSNDCYNTEYTEIERLTTTAKKVILHGQLNVGRIFCHFTVKNRRCTLIYDILFKLNNEQLTARCLTLQSAIRPPPLSKLNPQV